MPDRRPLDDHAFDRLARGVAVEVRAFVQANGRRRAVPLTAYVGVPGAASQAFVHSVPHDPVLATDLVERAVDALATRDVEQHRACAWATRLSDLEPDTRDLEWWHACHAGFARHGLRLPAFFVVGRYGWHELYTGRTRSWRRVRSRRVRAPEPTGPWQE